MTPALWGLILAGKHGLELRALTRLAATDHGRATLVVLSEHEEHHASRVSETSPRCLLAQPRDRGTAAAILYGLLRVSAVSPMGTMAVFPTEHELSNDPAFLSYVAAACDEVEQRPDLVTLLGMTSWRDDCDCGWIEPGESLPRGTLRRVHGLWERPPVETSRKLAGRAFLRDSQVIVARVPTLLALIRLALPGLYNAFEVVKAIVDTPAERGAIERVYAGLRRTSFFETVLVRRPANLAVLTVDLTWSDRHALQSELMTPL